MMNLADIIRLKFPDVDFHKDVLVQDDGNGPYIKEWNLTVSKPTQKDLDDWSIEFDLPYRQQQAILKRVYPPIGDQLDMIYNDQINNTTVWKDTITSIKLAYPKPME